MEIEAMKLRQAISGRDTSTDPPASHEDNKVKLAVLGRDTSNDPTASRQIITPNWLFLAEKSIDCRICMRNLQLNLQGV
jgi:hypothetical protein